MPAQVLGELRKAMEDIASFNRIVWDEVTQTCKEGVGAHQQQLPQEHRSVPCAGR